MAPVAGPLDLLGVELPALVDGDHTVQQIAAALPSHDHRRRLSAVARR
ncbi:hypothetical protein ACQHIV_32680 [Kribbella sp. GL6]